MTPAILFVQALCVPVGLSLVYLLVVEIWLGDRG